MSSPREQSFLNSWSFLRIEAGIGLLELDGKPSLLKAFRIDGI
jgi:hypothetical protein